MINSTSEMKGMVPLNLVRLLLLILFMGICESCSSDEVVPVPSDKETVEILGSPALEIDHNRQYRFDISGNTTAGDTIIYFNFILPDWLELTAEKNAIIGTAGWDNIDRNFRISFSATNRIDTVSKTWMVQVNTGDIICDQGFGDPNESAYILPFAVGNEYKIIQSYCPTNPNWGHHKSFAYDFEMEIGETIVASRAGEVIATQSSKPDNILNCGGGTANWVFILHDDGTVMQYVHLKEGGVHVSVGDFVEQGDTLGVSGNSGCSSGPHTHVSLFRTRGQYDKEDTLPFNYSNTDGMLDGNNGLIRNQWYKAN